jgi:prepilin peptidase CpaA
MRLLTLTLLCAGTVTDLKRREVPDAVPLVLLVAAIVAKGFGGADLSWSSLFGGLAIGLGLGVLLFWLGAFGGGDVKVLASVGAVSGVATLTSVLFYTALAGGAIALVAVVRGVRELPYMPAITLGYAAAWALEGRW